MMTLNNLNQGQGYNLTLKITNNGVMPDSILNAKFSIIRRNELVTTILYGSGISYEEGIINIRLGSEITELLSGQYNYEFWYMLSDGTKIMPKSDSIHFKPTYTRFQ